MSSLNNINNNSSVVNVGRTTPVTPGAQPAAKSIPVVVATDQTAIPVVEQNKIQSEVALSLLGIPRSEVALGIFADVNTYDVNPTEWSSEPAEYSELPNTLPQYSGIGGAQGWGIKHLPEESGALVTAPADESAVLTSKRFFRYQPGRVSAATFGIKSSTFQGSVLGSEQRPAVRNPGINKYGIFDKFDGYYWETSDTGEGDQFRVVRRTQSILRYNPLPFGNQAGEQLEDHALGGKPPAQAASTYNQYPTATKYLSENRFELIEKSAIINESVKCHRDVGYFLDGVALDITLGTSYNAVFQAMAESNSNEYAPLPAAVITAISNTRSEVKALAGVDATGDAAVDVFFDKLEGLVVNTGSGIYLAKPTDPANTTQATQIAALKSITYTNPSSGATAGQIAAAAAIQANLDWLAEEVNTYVENYYPGHTGTTIAAKCTRDVLFAAQAATYDVLYGGNSATHDAARFFFYDGFGKSDQSEDVLDQTVAAYKHLKGVIDDVVLGQAYAPQARCTRDLEYILEGVGYDLTLGTNYHATFQALAESNSTEYPEDSTTAVNSTTNKPWFRVVGAVDATEVAVKALAGVDATADIAVDDFYNRLREIAVDQNTRVEYGSTTQAKQIAFLKEVTFTNPTSGRTASQLAVKDKIQANYDFLTAEINAWVAQEYPDSRHPVAKCTRDVLFIANAVAHDMCYGGNFATTQATEFFFYEDFAQTTELHKNQTVAAYERLVEIISDVVTGTTVIKSNGNNEAQVTTGTDADAAEGTAAAALVQIVVDAIDAANDTGLPAVVAPDTTWAAISYRNAKFAIDADANTIASNASATAYSGYIFPTTYSQNLVNVATIAEARKVTDLMAIILGVIKEGDIVNSLPGNRDVPSRSWQTNASLNNAADAIVENKEAILDTVAPITWTESDDLKCLRDLEFALDAYIADLRWGGNGHTITNATTYQTAILADAEREGEAHYYFRYVLRDALYKIGEIDARAKLANLAGYQIQAVTANGTPGSKYPPQAGPDGTTGVITQAQITAASWGQRPKIDTIFSVYDKYLGYLVSDSLTYDTADFVNAEKGFTYADAQAYEEVLKYKCLRDVRFVVGAYASDLQYGGNQATAYNAKKYYADGKLQVYSQTNGGVVAEVQRHQYLKWLLTGTGSGFSKAGYTDVCTYFGLSDAQKTKLEELADIIIGNFTNEYQGAIEYGDAGQFGDLVILRDGLIMVHAAVYDPTLLKKKVKSPAKLDITNNAISFAEGTVIIGSFVNYYGDCPDLEDGKTYYVANVTGPKSNVIQLADPTAEGFNQFDFNPDTGIIELTDAGTGPHYIETPVPFIFPDAYENVDPAWTLGSRRYDGLFPYLYTDTGTLPADAGVLTAGFIDTAIDTASDPSTLRTQIDELNLKYKSWVRDNVDPTYYSVYEFRVGRTRFSGDSLDGETRTAVYSDNVLDKRAGEQFLLGDVAAEQTSVWDMDFSKVTMLKVEFSWYGAVGALFLAYVPVDNGEARWVRVHHLRCSNQLKISSLGNATLPITYLVYGGGSEKRFGIENASRLSNPYGSYSESVVKYGASYYIDGGDRGTVRLFNHSSEIPTDVYGSRYKLGVDSANATDPVSPYIAVTNRDPDATGNNAPTVSTFYMGGKVITGNSQDQNVKIIWVDAANNRLYLNKPISQVNTLSIIVDRPALVYGLKTKDNIVSGDGNDVRNRVQVYPTRLSVGASGSSNAKLTLLKTPLFQTTTSTSGTISVTSEVDLNSSYQISVNNDAYLKENGDFTYGWFLASLNGSETLVNVLGRLTKANDAYFFYPEDIYNGTLVIASGASFLKEGVFDPRGNTLTSSETTFEKERLSSVEVALRAQAPIPETGVSLASYYVAPGAEEFDLATYFDYNKEYISYPLTDEIATLWLATYSNQINTASEQVSLSASFTWEEQ
jgi:hypothetical protein